MEKIKSKRHSKIVGDFGEHLVCYWLSKRNFQPVIVDYIGIDIVAYNNNSKERLGISVKSRTRQKTQSQKSEFLLKTKQFPLIYEACKFFDAKPYFGIVVDQDVFQRIEIYIIPFENILNINKFKEGNKSLSIRVSEEYTKQYENVKNSIVIKMNYEEL